MSIVLENTWRSNFQNFSGVTSGIYGLARIRVFPWVKFDGGDNFFSEDFFRISWGGILDGDNLRMGRDNGGGLTRT